VAVERAASVPELADRRRTHRDLHLRSAPLPGRVRDATGSRDVVEASPDKPYLCLRIGIDPEVISELLIQMRNGATGATATLAISAPRLLPHSRARSTGMTSTR
jgi:hypothetical protein